MRYLKFFLLICPACNPYKLSLICWQTITGISLQYFVRKHWAMEQRLDAAYCTYRLHAVEYYQSGDTNQQKPDYRPNKPIFISLSSTV